MNRAKRIEIANETVAIVETGEYRTGAGRRVEIQAAVEACLSETRYIDASAQESLRAAMLASAPRFASTRIELENESTLQGIARHASAPGGVAALNFASARNPGGGFLRGAQAQEESLARSSALYASQLRAFEFYDRHRHERSLLYSDAMILSPRCPILRNDAGALLEVPVAASFITSAAPNATAVAREQPERVGHIEATLRRRSEYVLALAASTRCSTLVLGAWGCGVFGNDPKLVAACFGEHLRAGGDWYGRFDRVVFSVLDTSASRPTFAAFERTFVSE